jgi:hypothetical protein
VLASSTQRRYEVAVEADSHSNEGVAVEIEPAGVSGVTTPGTADWIVHVNVCDVVMLEK